LLAASVAALAASSARAAVASVEISTVETTSVAVSALSIETVPRPAVPVAAPAVPRTVHVIVRAPPNGANVVAVATPAVTVTDSFAATPLNGVVTSEAEADGALVNASPA